MKRAKKVGAMALLESQEYDKESTKTSNYWYMFLFFDKSLKMFELISCYK